MRQQSHLAKSDRTKSDRLSKRNCLIALNAAEQIHRAALCSLAGSAEEWMNIRADDAPRMAFRLGVPSKALQRAIALRPDCQRLADQELERASRRGVRVITLDDEDYPSVLRDHPLPPPVLYCRGTLPGGTSVAIVGSRKMSPYGLEVTQLFARHLATAGVVVVSGFALGVDSVAHRTTLSVTGGKTIAVLGCGLDINYPRGHHELAQEIARDGAVISEFPMGSPPLRWHFPIRNRVIAGLATGTLVVQAAQRSGSLITAHQALELGRDVYAVPGSIFDDLAAGPNRLIADGALPVLEPDDILCALPLAQQQELFPSQKIQVIGDSTTTPAVERFAPSPKGFAGKLLTRLPSADDMSAEDLAQGVSADINRVLAALLELELGGWVRRLPGPSYRRISA